MEKLDIEEKQLAQQLKQTCDDNGIEKTPKNSAKILHKLGQVYRKRSPDLISLIKSAALMNAAIARSPDNVDQIENDLKELCEHVLETASAADKNADLIFQSQVVKQAIAKLRKLVDDELGKMKNIPDNITGKKLKILECRKITSIQRLQNKIAEEYTKVMLDLASYCQDIMGEAPCKFAIAGMGSLARKEITPYSDFEHIILLDRLIDHENKEVMHYFKWFTVIFQIVLINLQETIIPSVAISTLNDETSMTDNWFYDNYTTRGVSFDGMMLHACKFPLGRQQSTKLKPWKTELIKPVSEMLKYLNSEEDLKNGYHLKDILTKTCFVYGERALFKEFENGAFSLLCNQDQNHTLKTVKKQLIDDLQKHATRSTVFQVYSDSAINVKKHVYRISSLFTSALGTIYGIHACSGFEIVAQLAEMQEITDYAKHKLLYAVAIACEIRLRWYMKNKSQTDYIANGDAVTTFLDIVGKASSLSYFQISYALQCDISKRFNLHKSHFYSNPQLLNMNLFDLLNNDINIVHSLSGQHYFEEKTQRFINFDECLKSMEAVAVSNNKEKSFYPTSFQANSHLVEMLKVNFLLDLGNILINSQCFDDALEFFEKTLSVLRTILPADVLPILNETKIEESLDDLLEDLAHRVEAEQKPNKSLCSDLCVRNIFETFIVASLKKYGCMWVLNILSKAEDHMKGLLQTLCKVNFDQKYTYVITIIYLFGAHFLKLKRFLEAKKCYDTIQKLFSKFSLVHEQKSVEALILSNSALCSAGMDKHSEAEHYLEEIISIIEKESIDEIFMTGILKNIGFIRLKLNQHAEAQTCFDKALKFVSKISGGHCDERMAIMLLDIGVCMEKENKLNAAIDHYEEALQILKRTSLNVDNDFNIGCAFQSLGRCLTKLNKIEEAKMYIEKSLQITQNSSTNVDIDYDTAINYATLGQCLMESNELVKSKECFEKSLNILRQISSDKHKNKDLAEILRHLGMCLMKMNKPNEARAQFERSLEICRQNAPEDDIDIPNENMVAVLELRLGDCFIEMGKHEEAKLHFERSLEIYKEIPGKDDSYKLNINEAIVFRAMGHCLMKMKRHKKAKTCFENSLQIFEQISRTEDWDAIKLKAAIAMHDIGLCLTEMKQFNKAKHYFVKSLNIKQKISNDAEFDISIAHTSKSLGLCLMNSDNFDEALTYLEQFLKIVQQMPRDSTSNLFVCVGLHDVGLCLMRMCKFQEASDNLKQSVQIVRNLSRDDCVEAGELKPLIEKAYRDCLKNMKNHI